MNPFESCARFEGRFTQTNPSCNINSATLHRNFLPIFYAVPICRRSSFDSRILPLQAWTGREGSTRLRFPYFKTVGTWRWWGCQPYAPDRLYSPGNIPGTHFLCDFDRASSLICGNKMPTRCNRGFYCRSYCLFNMFRAPLCPSSGAQSVLYSGCCLWYFVL